MLFTKAFTLIELLIVLAIVAILSAISMPAYDRYVIKTRVTELLSLAHTYKLRLVEDMLDNATNNDQIYAIDTDVVSNVHVKIQDVEPPKYVVQVEAKMKTPGSNGIGLKMSKNSKKPLILQLQGINVGDVINWTCHVDEQYNDYVPTHCKNNDLEELRNN